MKPTPQIINDRIFASVRITARGNFKRRPSDPQTMIPVSRFPQVACSDELSKIEW